MNHKTLFKKNLEKSFYEFPEMSIGEVLYSFLRPKMLLREENNVDMSHVEMPCIKWLRELNDEDLHYALERFLKFEMKTYG